MQKDSGIFMPDTELAMPLSSVIGCEDDGLPFELLSGRVRSRFFERYPNKKISIGNYVVVGNIQPDSNQRVGDTYQLKNLATMRVTKLTWLENGDLRFWAKRLQEIPKDIL